MQDRSIRKKIRIGAIILSIGFVAVFGGYAAVLHSINRACYPVEESAVMVRPFPYPYRAALAISNDIDNTGTFEEFVEIHKFLNTHEKTSMGEGVGLNIGNTFLFWEPPLGKTISYFGSTDPRIAKTIMKYIRDGQIDIIHSYGQKPDFSREDMVAAIRELRKNDIYLDTWIDHSRSHSNMGDDVTFGLGDHPEAKEYHADVTLAYGVKFAWLGRLTMITGQSVPLTGQSFMSIFDADHPLHSFLNISKEWAKNAAALLGSRKYAMHKDNDLVRIASLDNGKKIYEFTRFDNNWQGVGVGASAKGLAYSISRRTLDRLKEDGGYMIVYTHLGVNDNCNQLLCKETQDALRNLAEEYNAGQIFVTTTSRLLNYYVRHKYLKWSSEARDGFTKIHITSINDPVTGTYVPSVSQLAGITFYVPDANRTLIYVNDVLIDSLKKNKQDYRGRESITILPDKKATALEAVSALARTDE